MQKIVISADKGYIKILKKRKRRNRFRLQCMWEKACILEIPVQVQGKMRELRYNEIPLRFLSDTFTI